MEWYRVDAKHFTVDQANEALPVLREAVGTLQDRMKWLHENPPEIPFIVKEFRIPFDAPVSRPYFTRLIEVREALGEVHSLGCQIKDIRMGLVDFPSRLFGKEVLLCWRVGEEAVEYYHDLESGYSGRQPIPEGALERGGSGEKSGGRHD
jgi:hypothetical protein